MTEPQTSILPKKSPISYVVEGVRTRATQAFSDKMFLKANGLPINPRSPEKQEAVDIFIEAPGAPPAPTSHASQEWLNILLAQHDFEVKNKSKQMKTYVLTKLFETAEGKDKNLAMRALETLGKVSEIGLFTTKIEININNRPTQELEEELHNLLKGYNMDVIEGQLVKVAGQLSLEREMLGDEELEGDYE
ncbi:MAG: hypothetical protein LUQ26_09940 [Methylococcaceae bacterium]|nr:hypothetical protein [Methylococcaceae bacterium]